MSVLTDAAGVVRKVWNHPANRGRRVRALRRAISYQVMARTFGRTAVASVGDRGRVVVRLHDNGSSHALYANPPDFAEMQFWRKWLRPGDLFLDVGANVGIYSLWAADIGVETWAFEPHPVARERLQENAALSGLDIRSFDCALGAAEGRMSFTTNLGTSNHLTVGTDGDVTVEVRRADDVVGKRTVHGVKIDVEGAERLVLEGASGLLERGQIQVLQIEWNHMSRVTLGEGREAVGDILQRAGYLTFRLIDGAAVATAVEDLTEGPEDVFAASPEAARRLGLVHS